MYEVGKCFYTSWRKEISNFMTNQYLLNLSKSLQSETKNQAQDAAHNIFYVRSDLSRKKLIYSLWEIVQYIYLLNFFFIFSEKKDIAKRSYPSESALLKNSPIMFSLMYVVVCSHWPLEARQIENSSMECTNDAACHVWN